MTSKADWRFRADFLKVQADYLDKKANELLDEADRYRRLAKQAAFNAEGKELVE